MKLVALALTLLVAGFGASYALAKGKPPKHGEPTTTVSTAATTSTSTTTSKPKSKKVAICRRAGKSGRWVKVTVAGKAAAKAQLKKGAVLPDASGKCPASSKPAKHGTTTTGSTTTNAA